MKSQRARTLLLGDWSRLIRDPADLLRLTFVVGAVLALPFGDVGQSLRLVLTVALVSVPRLLDMPRPFDLAFTLGMSLQAWGNVFGLFDQLGWYDKLVHVVLPMMTAPTLYVALVRLGVLPDTTERHERHRYVGLALVTTVLGLGLGALYEMYEFAVDHLADTNHIEGVTDTITDLIADAVGSALGGAGLVLWAAYGWSSSRRVPERRIP